MTETPKPVSQALVDLHAEIEKLINAKPADALVTVVTIVGPNQKNAADGEWSFDLATRGIANLQLSEEFIRTCPKEVADRDWNAIVHKLVQMDNPNPEDRKQILNFLLASRTLYEYIIRDFSSRVRNIQEALAREFKRGKHVQVKLVPLAADTEYIASFVGATVSMTYTVVDDHALFKMKVLNASNMEFANCVDPDNAYVYVGSTDLAGHVTHFAGVPIMVCGERLIFSLPDASREDDMLITPVMIDVVERSSLN